MDRAIGTVPELTMCQTYILCTTRESNPGLNNDNNNTFTNNVNCSCNDSINNSSDINIIINIWSNGSSKCIINGSSTSNSNHSSNDSSNRTWFCVWLGLYCCGAVVFGVGGLMGCKGYPQVESGTLGYCLIGLHRGRGTSQTQHLGEMDHHVQDKVGRGLGSNAEERIEGGWDQGGGVRRCISDLVHNG